MAGKTMKYNKGQIYNLQVKEIINNPKQPRKHFDEVALEELVQSIKQHDVLTPVIFRVNEDGGIELVAGERRLRAAKELKMDTIPAVFNDGDPSEIALIENILRQDLTAVEEAEAIGRLKEEKGYTDEQLGGVLGKKRSTISDMLLINKLPEDVRKECRESSRYSRRELIQIARRKTPKGMKSEFEKYKHRLDKTKDDGKKARPKGDKVKATSQAILVLKEKIDKVSREWDEKEKAALFGPLSALKKSIESF